MSADGVDRILTEVSGLREEVRQLKTDHEVRGASAEGRLTALEGRMDFLKETLLGDPREPGTGIVPKVKYVYDAESKRQEQADQLGMVAKKNILERGIQVGTVLMLAGLVWLLASGQLVKP